MRRYYLRTCHADMTSYNGFQWPGVGETVTAPDWSPVAECGQGLHGLLDGVGDGGLLNWSPEAKWIVFSSANKPVDLIVKHKVKTAGVEFVGNRKTATDWLMAHVAADKPVVGGYKTGGYRSTLTGGDGSTLCWRVWDGARYRLHVRYVAEDGIKSSTPYRFVDGKIAEVKL